MGKWKRAGGMVPVVVLLALFGWTVYAVLRGPTVGEHMTRAEAPIALPEGATDVCYWLRAPFWPNTAYEFSVPEKGFRQWAEEKGWPLRDIGDEPIEIYRYTAFAHLADAEESVSVADGLYYQCAPEDDDGGIYVVYDRREGRAYFYAHTR